MKIDHVHFYTRNAARTGDWFIHNVGFRAIGRGISQNTHTEVIALSSVFFVISSPLNNASPVADYLNSHPSGIVDVAFRVENIQPIIDRAKYLGVEILQSPQAYESSLLEFGAAKIVGWDSLHHTLIEVGTGEPDYCLPNLKIDSYPAEVNLNCKLKDNLGENSADISRAQINHIDRIDHLVLNVAAGQLNSAVEIYQALFQFKIRQSFQIQTEKSGLFSQALVDQSGLVQFNINEPTTPTSQIQEFIELNNGSGIQHLALRSQNLIADVTRMQDIQDDQMDFLLIPQSYYQRLEQESWLSRQDLKAIAAQQILVDGDRRYPHSLLMQIFTQPIFERPTFFLEFIERRQGAKGFGQGNFKALFEAVEREQIKRT